MRGCAILLGLAFLGVAGLALLILLGGDRYPDEEEQAEYRAACAPVIAWLERTYELSSKFPDDLQEAEARLLHDLYPEGQYVPYEDRKGYMILIGEYAENLWVYMYYGRPDGGEWLLDS